VKLLVATTNRNKVREIRQLLDGVPLELTTLDEWKHVEAPPETGRTFEENARAKALYYAAATHELTVAEDSGLEIDALGGAPGVESARYGGEDSTYSRKFELIYDALRAHPGADRTARFVCAVALVNDGRLLFETRGTVAGLIAPAPAGAAGFGYDPIFFYPPYGRTLGQSTAEEKTAVSHRGEAFRAVRRFLETALQASAFEQVESQPRDPETAAPKKS
jgi:XTP/dITP diphosphohydrolase